MFFIAPINDSPFEHYFCTSRLHRSGHTVTIVSVTAFEDTLIQIIDFLHQMSVTRPYGTQWWHSWAVSCSARSSSTILFISAVFISSFPVTVTAV